MLVRAALIIEFFTIAYMIAQILGKEFKVDMGAAAFILVAMSIQDVLTILKINEINTIFYCVEIFLYSILRYKETVSKSLKATVLLSLFITIFQFICAILWGLLLPDKESIRVFLINLTVLVSAVVFLPKLKPNKLSRTIPWKSKYTVHVFSFVGFILLWLYCQTKFRHEIRMDRFIFLILMIVILLTVFIKWKNTEISIEKLEKEKKNNEKMQIKYDKLLLEVRLRQHEFKNHMAAVLSSHYTYKTYEQLVNAQSKYYKTLEKENKYNNLLFIGNNILAGFLYEKFKEMDEERIDLNYSIQAKFVHLRMLNYHLIEIVGILMDNAVEAIKASQDKRICIELFERDNRCYFAIRNPHPYVKYSELEQLFQAGISTKGSGRGLGLFHVKTLCDESGDTIACQNVEIEGENWMEFMAGFNKTDNPEM